MKIKDVSKAQLVEYLRLTDYDPLVDIAAAAARRFIENYTGLTAEIINENDDLTIAYLILISDFYDNRQNSTDRNYSNLAVQTILDMHRSNILPSGGG